MGSRLPLFAVVVAVSAFAFLAPQTAEAKLDRTLPSLPASAEAVAVLEEDGPQLRARLLISDAAGEEATRRVGVLFDLAPGWHLYWRNPGETGIAPALEFEARGLRAGEIQWPAPETFREAEGLFTTYGYEGQVLLSAPLHPTSAEANARTPTGGHRVENEIRVDGNVLICRTECVPASFRLSAPLDGRLPPDEQTRVDVLFRDAIEKTPVEAGRAGLEVVAHWTREALREDDTGQLALTIPGCSALGVDCPSLVGDAHHAVFLPFEDGAFELLGTTVDDARVTLDVTRLEAGPNRLRGLLRSERGIKGSSARYASVDLPIQSGPAAATSGATASAPIEIPLARWAQIFCLALLGGLILNGMPCVLPVLAIKVVAIADLAEKDPREVRLHGLAYTGGVLASMAVLAGIVLALRAAGHSVGWGFQFQEPLFVAGISALLVAFALNLFGVFEIELGQGRLASVGQDRTGRSRSAFEGLLAVILATPCTAPFLGTAVGFAFATSGVGIAAIFVAIGLGLASPFLIVSFVPSLSRFIPRSGPWMMQLRAGLGFSLLATVIWLLWVLGQTGGTGAVIAMTANLLGLAFLLWGFGQLQPIGSAWMARASAVMIAGIAFAGFNLIDFERVEASPGADSAADAKEAWKPYSERAVSDAVSKGQRAFVVFTADWCITCQVNERTVLARREIREAFERHDVALFKADWTQRDERIRAKLAEFGRAGVPLYLVYDPQHPDEPQVLGELLTKRDVLAALRQASEPDTDHASRS